MKLGAAVNHAHLWDAAEPAYEATFARAFDSLTPEYELKVDQLLPQPGAWDFSVADRLLAYAESHGKELRGHTLVWHRALPAWMLARSWTRDDLLAFLKSYVATVVGRYRGRIAEWDVVNEAFEDDGTWRRSLWYDVIGPDYVEQAFRFAREADPAARLFYNDYGAERVNAKSDAVLALAARLRGAGLADGVGFQAHLAADGYPTEADLSANLARFADAGLEVAITELDVSLASAAGTLDDRLRLQASIYAGVAAACRAQPACRRITVWGVTDKYGWLGAGALPLPFDASYAEKPAWSALRAAAPR
ncbi:MAG TPA: endo-1,4-beta-xylanase [Anaeromyxobacter sp.]|nr:endo-1,4-beta-xylanase [Anaeromyxobacter sp.]